MKILDKSIVWARGVRSLLCLLIIVFVPACKQSNVSNAKPNATYIVEHWQENIADSEYTKLLEEIKIGKAGEKTLAKAREYKGFKPEAIAQEKVKADGSTIVKVLYKRNIISLILDLQGGKTTTRLKETAGKNILEGKFGASVNVENPTKENFAFGGFTPSLPKTFLLDEDKKEYVAQWGKVVRINIIEGDERLEVKEREVSFPIEKVRTFGDVKAKLAEKISLKPAWMSGDYGIYDFRRENYEGEEIKDDSPVEDGMKVYPRSNYIKFEWSKKDVLVNYTGEKPRGKIIIPTKTIGISDVWTEEYDDIGLFEYCSELVAVDLTGCSELKKISGKAFDYCPKLESMNFTGCSSLESIEFNDFHQNKFISKLKNITLTGCSAVTKVALSNGLMTSIDLSSCANLHEIWLIDCSKLKTINLTGCNKLTRIGIRASLVLKSIDLSSCPKLSDFDFCSCYDLESVNITGCSELKSATFCNGASVKNLDLSAFKKLEQFTCHVGKSLESVDLSGCSALKRLWRYTFEDCKNAEVKLGKWIEKIDEFALVGCKKVLVPNETIKQLVKASNYPEDRIEMYH
ncbi:MAG: leucine-rich repeat protein [Treponema sp.]